MTNTASPAATPAHRDAQGFPMDPCDRCNGTGQFSWNAVTGSRCFKCNGNRYTYAKAVAAIVRPLQAARAEAVRPTVATVAAGDVVAPCGQFNRRRCGDWRTVAHAGPTPRITARMGDQVVGFMVALTYTDGTTEDVASGTMVARQLPAQDVTEALAAAEAAWQRAAKAKARRASR